MICPNKVSSFSYLNLQKIVLDNKFVLFGILNNLGQYIESMCQVKNRRLKKLQVREVYEIILLVTLNFTFEVY